MMTPMSAMYILHVLVVSLRYGCGVKDEINIGVLLSESSKTNGIHASLTLAVDYVNSLPDVLPGHRLIASVDTSEDRTYQSIRSACYLIQNGASLLIGPSRSNTVTVTNSVASGLNIPQITPYATDPQLSSQPQQYPNLLKMSAPDNIMNAALIDLALYYGWSRFAIIASNNDYGKNGIQEFQRLAASYDWVITTSFYFYPTNNVSNIDVTYNLREIKNKGGRVIVLNCLSLYANVIMRQAAKLGMTGKGWAWLVTDGITGMPGLFDPCAEVPLYLRGLVGIRPAYGRGLLYETFRKLWLQNENNSALQLQVYTLRTFDAVLSAAYGLHDYFQDGHSLTSHTFGGNVCQDPDIMPNLDGQLLHKYIQMSDGPGVMNHLNFTNAGFPLITDYEIVNLQIDGWVPIGDWSPSRPDQERLEMDSINKAVFSGGTTDAPQDTHVDLRNVTLRVVTLLEEPFIMLTTQDERKNDPKRLYKGYCIDLLLELKDMLNFAFKIHFVADGTYGSQQALTGEWSGLMGELIRNEADLILSPLTINYEREQDVEFTKPYMDLGLSILLAKATPANNFLAFLEPFQWGLWAAVVVAFIVCAVATSMCSFFSPYGYHGMYAQRVNKMSTKGYEQRNVLRLWNSLWYSFSSWMQQGADFSPRSVSGRLIHGVWWFAVMVIAATYTANLAAFLTVARLDTGINSVSELAEQDDIKYGTVSGTAVEKFFREQISYPYNKMWKKMESSDTMLHNSSEAIRRVRETHNSKERYAFIWDSAILEYEGNNKPCVTSTVGQIFNQFGYGLAFRKNSPYVDSFSLAVLKLRQDGFLDALRKRWISGACQSSEAESSQTVEGTQTTLADMAGVFAMLLLGLGLSFFVVICEYCVATSREVKAAANAGESVSFSTALRRRLVAVRDDIQKQVSCCSQKRPSAHCGDAHAHGNGTNGEIKKMRLDQYKPSAFQNQAFKFGPVFEADQKNLDSGPNDVDTSNQMCLHVSCHAAAV